MHLLPPMLPHPKLLFFLKRVVQRWAGLMRSLAVRVRLACGGFAERSLMILFAVERSCSGTPRPFALIWVYDFALRSNMKCSKLLTVDVSMKRRTGIFGPAPRVLLMMTSQDALLLSFPRQEVRQVNASKMMGKLMEVVVALMFEAVLLRRLPLWILKPSTKSRRSLCASPRALAKVNARRLCPLSWVSVNTTRGAKLRTDAN